MLRRFAVLLILPTVLLAALIGCGDTNPAKETSKDSSGKDAAAGKDAGKAGEDLPGLKELNEADRKLAEQQKFCPKTGELLGSMGKPYKITLNNRVVFLCCEGCEEEVKKDPAKYLKILDDKMAKK
ncbi:MAG: TRASH domain-containing protein [Thermoguttaceae bacterium]